MAKVSLAGVEVDLSGFTPTTYAVDGGSRGGPPAIDGIGLSSFSYRPATCTVPATRSTGTSGFTRRRTGRVGERGPAG